MDRRAFLKVSASATVIAAVPGLALPQVRPSPAAKGMFHYLNFVDGSSIIVPCYEVVITAALFITKSAYNVPHAMTLVPRTHLLYKGLVFVPYADSYTHRNICACAGDTINYTVSLARDRHGL